MGGGLAYLPGPLWKAARLSLAVGVAAMAAAAVVGHPAIGAAAAAGLLIGTLTSLASGWLFALGVGPMSSAVGRLSLASVLALAVGLGLGQPWVVAAGAAVAQGILVAVAAHEVIR